MNQVDAEIVEPSNAIALRPSMAVGQALGVDEIVAQVKLIQDVMHKVMKDGEHYGTIPGCGTKKTLLQPGAQKLTMTFRLAPAYEIQEVNLERGHKEYRVICTLKNIVSGSFVGQGVGCCSSMESKYRWRGGSRKCPECGKETIIKGKAEYGGGWLCFQKKGGCGHKWPDGAAEIEGQNIERVENDNPADTFNTVFKMAKKRAFVDATITATAASDIFTQDIADDGEPADDPVYIEPTKPKTVSPQFKAQTPVQSVKTPPAASQVAKSVPVVATAAQRDKIIQVIESEGPDAIQKALGYFIEVGALLPTEKLSDLPLYWVPTMASQMREIGALIAKLNDTGKAEKPAYVTDHHALKSEQTRAVTNPATAFNAGEDETSPFVEPEQARAETTAKQPELTSKPQSEHENESWYSVIVPIPHKGQKRDEYLKNPDTIGSLFDARHDDEEARRRLFGFLNNFEPKPWTGKDGKERPPSKSDIEFRKGLDLFGEYYDANHDGERFD